MLDDGAKIFDLHSIRYNDKKGYRRTLSSIPVSIQDGDTAMLEAAKHGKLNIVKLLLKSGANKNHQNKVSLCAGAC